MSDLTRLEHALAEVMTLEDLAGDVLETLRRLTEASATLLFVFDQPLVPRIVGGSLAPAMHDYTAELFREDWVQADCLSRPAATFLTRDDGDWAAHSRSRPYADFYRPRQVGFMKGVWPTGLRYGSRGMFGALLTKSKLTQRFDSRACRLLHQIESPLRAAARRIARLGHMTQERDVLRQVLSARRGAFALWGPELCLMWLSPEAENCFRDVFVREGVQELALIAARQTKLAKSVSEGCMLGRPHEVNARTGEALTVQFCRIRAADERPWLLAELKDGKDVHETLARLTSAELRVLRLLVRGASNREICGKLFVSQETVKTHVARILRKLGVSSRSKAASLARDAGLVEA